jgi:hypothetical protein
VGDTGSIINWDDDVCSLSSATDVSLCRGLLKSQRLNPIFVAVPKRELGDGLLERARNVVRIRRRLDRLGYHCGLHLLGTGNPISILEYSLCGADTFGSYA